MYQLIFRSLHRRGRGGGGSPCVSAATVFRFSSLYCRCEVTPIFCSTTCKKKTSNSPSPWIVLQHCRRNSKNRARCAHVTWENVSHAAKVIVKKEGLDRLRVVKFTICGQGRCQLVSRCAIVRMRDSHMHYTWPQAQVPESASASHTDIAGTRTR